MNAADTAAALAARAEAVCRKYLANGCKQGRYWTAGDVRGAKGRSLFVRLAPPGIPGKWFESNRSRSMTIPPRTTTGNRLRCTRTCHRYHGYRPLLYRPSRSN